MNSPAMKRRPAKQAGRANPHSQANRLAKKARRDTPSRSGRHSFSLYYPPHERWELLLADQLAGRQATTLGNLMRSVMRTALIANGLISSEGISLVPGIGPSKKEAKAAQVVSEAALRLASNGS